MKALPYLLFLALFACKDPEPVQQDSGVQTDTTVVSYNTIYHGKFDSSQCVSYAFSIGGRNTGFTCSACQHLGRPLAGKVDIQLLGGYSKPVSYRKELRYLQQILPLIVKRFPVDSLDCISMGDITDHPDLAVNLTKEYAQRYGSLDWSAGPKDIRDFFNSSVVAKDLKRMLAPYSVNVLRLGGEKLSMSEGARNLLDKSAMESDTTKIPEKIMDGTLYVYLRKD